MPCGLGGFFCFPPFANLSARDFRVRVRVCTLEGSALSLAAARSLWTWRKLSLPAPLGLGLGLRGNARTAGPKASGTSRVKMELKAAQVAQVQPPHPRVKEERLSTPPGQLTSLSWPRWQSCSRIGAHQKPKTMLSFSPSPHP